MVSDFTAKSVVMGYVVLDDSSSSNLLTSDEELVKLIKDAKICSIHRFKEDFSDKLKEASELLDKLSLSIHSDTVFKSNPRKSSACTYCELGKVCVKSELNS